ncbi:nitrate reductase delta subunit [Terribacillus halophilus]|uniref:Nitrate reductase delta subunit n=1 Tax=Terribacillus halophilus TaxID=361279 RepID=A0A1G6TFJ4_9BACI|nr:nitrate reductase molybdenum cofactor assembly chaperone [Terribacillus halophilus]SDD27634.1 nitrate reductase delta subunit [Terribacillus halophilus]
MPIALQVVSYLLRYPTRDLTDDLMDIRAFCAEMEPKEAQEHLAVFLKELEERDIDQIIDHYIHHFDFGRLTNLYVSYLKLGEQRERGLELLKLKMIYEAYGFTPTEEELPDYLPLLLEFCAYAPEAARKEVLEMHGKAINEIRSKLREEGSYYAALLDALFCLMEQEGIAWEPEEKAG